MPDKIKTFNPFPRSQPSQSRRDDINWYHRSRWLRLRTMKLRVDPLCETCGTPDDLHVHHRLPRKTHPHLAFQLENLKTLCRRCHTIEESSINQLEKQVDDLIDQLREIEP